MKVCLRQLLWWLLIGYATTTFASSVQLTLGEAYTRAMENDPQLQIARYQRDAAEARAGVSGSQMYPQVRLFGQFSQNEIDYDGGILPSQEYDGTRYGASLTQKLFDYSLFSQVEGAELRSDSATLSFEDETSYLAVRVAETYFSVLAQREQARAFSDELEALTQQAKQTQALVARQLATMTESLEVNARRDEVTTRKINADNKVALAEEAFFALIGARDVQPKPINGSFKPLTADVELDTALESAIQGNAKVLALEVETEAARTLIDQAKGTYLPSVDLVANQQYSDVGFDNTTSPPRTTVYVGLNINWALIEGGAGKARLQAGWADYYAAAERLKRQKQQVEQEVRSAWLELSASAQRIAASERSLESASESFTAAKKAQDLGVGKTFDVMLSRSAVTRAELNLNSARFDNVMAWIRFSYQTGRLTGAQLETLATHF